jgi:hypothetical protein
MDLPFYSVSAIVDTDTFPTRLPYAFFIKKGFSGVIPRGTPILTVFPFKRETWESEIVEYDKRDSEKNFSLIWSVFSQGYKKIFWNRKRYS